MQKLRFYQQHKLCGLFLVMNTHLILFGYHIRMKLSLGLFSMHPVIQDKDIEILFYLRPYL